MGDDYGLYCYCCCRCRFFFFCSLLALLLLLLLFHHCHNVYRLFEITIFPNIKLCIYKYVRSMYVCMPFHCDYILWKWQKPLKSSDLMRLNWIFRFVHSFILFHSSIFHSIGHHHRIVIFTFKTLTFIETLRSHSQFTIQNGWTSIYDIFFSYLAKTNFLLLCQFLSVWCRIGKLKIRNGYAFYHTQFE